MRTTLDIDDQVLALAKQFAREQNKTVGQVLSDLARKGLEPKDAPEYRNGIRVFRGKPGALPMTLEEINRIRDED
jgi:hypothetical protein